MSSDKTSIIDRAQQLAAKGQIDKAIEEWQKLIAETPNDGNIYNTIGDLHLKANHKNDALNAYLKAADAFKSAGFDLKSIAVFKKIIKVDPTRMDVYEKLADIHVERGLTGNAIEDYLKVAKHYVKQNDFRSALSVYRKLANLDPQNAGIRLKIAEVCQKQGLGKEAIEELERVLEIYESKQKAAEAKEVLKQILQIDPAYRRMTETSSVQKAESDASEEIKEPLPENTPAAEPSIAVEPAALQDTQPKLDPPAPSLEQRMEKTLAEGDWEGAEKIFEALEGKPVELFEYQSKWFDYYFSKGSFPKAFLVLQKAVSLADRHSYVDQGQLLVRRYLEENPQQLSAHELLGNFLEKAGREKEAVDCYSRVISLLLEQRSESEARVYYEKAKETHPAIGEIEKWRLLFDPAPVETVHEEPVGAQEPPVEAPLDAPLEIPIELSSQSAKSRGPSEISRGRQESHAPAVEEAASQEISEEVFKAHLTEADVYIKYGLNGKAIEQLLSVAQLAPLREEPHVQLKALFVKEGQTAKAVQECCALIRIYEKSGLEEKRTAILEELAVLDPTGEFRIQKVKEETRPPGTEALQMEEDLPPKQEFSEEYTAIEEPVETPRTELDDFREALEVSRKESDDAEALKRKMEQVEEYMKAGQQDAAKALLWKILEKHPDSAEARLELLKIQETSKKASSQAKQPQRAPAERIPDAIPLSGETDETSFEGLSEEAIERSLSNLISRNEASDPPEAEALPEEASKSEKTGNEEYVDLASIFSEELEEDRGQPLGAEETVLEDAFKDLQRGVQSQVDVQDFETHYNLGIAYKEMGLLPEAIKEFDLAFQGDVRFQDASIMLALCYQQRGTVNSAIEVLKNALSDERCSKENALAFKYELATIYDSEGMKDRAKSLYDEVCRIDPNFRDVAGKKAALESELSRQPVFSTKEGPKRNPENKKKNRISYL